MKITGSFAIIFAVIVFFILHVTENCYAISLHFTDIGWAADDYPYEKTLIIKSKVIEDMFITALGGDKAYNKIATIELGNKKPASITPEMMPEPIVKGIDKLGRPFIAYKQENKITGEQGVEVFYQRYSDDPYLWINGGDHVLKYLFPVNRGIVTKESIEQFANMIWGEEFVPVYDLKYRQYKNIYTETLSEFYVSYEAIEKIKQVIKADVRGRLPSGVKFLENGDNRTFILEDIAPNLMFKYYSRDRDDGNYIKLWNENAHISRNISELYELDLLIIPKTKIIKVNVGRKNYFVMAKENIVLDRCANDFTFRELKKLSHQLLTFMFKTGVGCIGPDSLLLLNIGDRVKAVFTFFEEFNLSIVNRNLVNQFFTIEVFRKNRELIEMLLNRFSYFRKQN